jgi:hypothetical protein
MDQGSGGNNRIRGFNLVVLPEDNRLLDNRVHYPALPTFNCRQFPV